MGRGAEYEAGFEMRAGEQAGDGELALGEEVIGTEAIAAGDQVAEAIEARVVRVVDRLHAARR